MSDIEPEPKTNAETIRRDHNLGPQIISVSRARWSAAAEARFLSALSASSNVTTAVAAAGFTATAIYRRRLRDPGFAQRWRDALETGYLRLEMKLLETAIDSLNGEPPLGEAPIPPMTVNEAMNILKIHQATVAGHAARQRGQYAALPPIEVVRAEIIRRVEAITGKPQ